MENKLNVGEMIKTGVILFLITAVSAALLAFVNGKTAPLIEQNSILKEQAALEAVMPGGEFTEVEVTPEIAALADGLGEIKKIYRVDTQSEFTGVCVITETSGYDIGIQTITGVDMDCVVTGVEITAMNETPGLGAKAAETDFRGQYKGMTYEIGVSKSSASDTEIQAISGATKTSKGVTNAVNIALKAADYYIEQGGLRENG